MDGTLMKDGKRYLMRINKDQVPVTFDGWGLWSGHGGEEGRKQYCFTRLDTGEVIFKPTARAISRHYDGCTLVSRPATCDCSARLQAESVTAPAQPVPATVEP